MNKLAVNQLFKRFFIIGSSIIIIGCYKAPKDSVSEMDLDVVQTSYTDVDYLEPGRYITYSVAERFSVASNDESADLSEINQAEFRSLVTGSIIKNMNSYGYQLFDSANSPLDSPDIYIAVNVTYINTRGVSYVPAGGGYGYGLGWGWGGYPSYGWGGYYYYYPTYYPVYYSYDQGSLHISWMDVQSVQTIPGDTLRFVDNIWNMSISGILRNASDKDRGSRIRAGIDTGFEQSPYLNKN